MSEFLRELKMKILSTDPTLEPTQYFSREELYELDLFFHEYAEIIAMAGGSPEERTSKMFVKSCKDKGMSNEEIKERLEEFKKTNL